MGDRRARFAAGNAALHHHHHRVFRFFIRRERGEPRRVIYHLIALVGHLRRAGFAANPQARHHRCLAGAFHILGFRQHGVVQNPQAASAHTDAVAHKSGRQIRRAAARHRIRRLNPRNQPWPEHCAAIRNRRIDHGHLQRCHRDFTLTNTNVRRVTGTPARMNARG